MAEVESRRDDPAPVCICVLCGLPAAGKSTLSRAVSRGAAKFGWRATVVTYDDLIPDPAFLTELPVNPVDLQEPQTQWKSQRQAVLHCIEQFLKNPRVFPEFPGGCQFMGSNPRTPSERVYHLDEAPILLLLDDNFYYPSMRYEVFQLARENSLSFCQVYLQCSLELCLSRNQTRPHPVPADVISEMNKRLVAPNSQKNSWENNSITLDTTNTLTVNDIQRVMECIRSAFNNPLSPIEDNTEQKEADRQKCAASILHQTDQACRRLISEAMKTARDNRVPSDTMKTLAAQLNESKNRFLHNLRTQSLQQSPFTPEEDINVDLVVKRAVGLFGHETKEIMSTVINSDS
ncbi:L-seryl-tRNA(Sec) kinase isoform X1 [Synchiropus splendidus]|uniref:L-seryl-tRNA(Sec) kinase isoform X1 n=1 Tax=Synchiropus splendidus TaxID=270530 RepID=UPI00237D8015|nr:L-seryl-tRNA(Sec) kinase isoform X1 [Synchiropus splendidus]